MLDKQIVTLSLERGMLLLLKEETESITCGSIPLHNYIISSKKKTCKKKLSHRRETNSTTTLSSSGNIIFCPSCIPFSTATCNTCFSLTNFSPKHHGQRSSLLMVSDPLLQPSSKLERELSRRSCQYKMAHPLHLEHLTFIESPIFLVVPLYRSSNETFRGRMPDLSNRKSADEIKIQ